MSGGLDGSSSSVELLHSDGSPWCSLPDLPEGRQGHSQTGLEACGGISVQHERWRRDVKIREKRESPPPPPPSTVMTNCVRFSGGRWTTSHDLIQKLYEPYSWASPAGTVLIPAANAYGEATHGINKLRKNNFGTSV